MIKYCPWYSQGYRIKGNGDRSGGGKWGVGENLETLRFNDFGLGDRELVGNRANLSVMRKVFV
jgi:hypothetical protein